MYNQQVWQDTTTYSRGEPRNPRALTLTLPNQVLTVYVVRNYQGDPTYVAFATGLVGFDVPLDADSFDSALPLAVELLVKRLEGFVEQAVEARDELLCIMEDDYV